MMWSEFFTPAAAAGGGQAGGGAAKSRPGPGSLTQNFPPEHCRRAGLGWAGLAAVTVSRVRYITTGTECGTNTAPRLPCHTGSTLARVGQRNQHDHVHPMGRISATLARPCQQWQPAGAAFLKPVSRILHHIHPCLIYEAIMRHIRDKYEAIMKQISLIFSKNEVFGPAFLFTTKLL